MTETTALVLFVLSVALCPGLFAIMLGTAFWIYRSNGKYWDTFYERRGSKRTPIEEILHAFSYERFPYFIITVVKVQLGYIVLAIAYAGVSIATILPLWEMYLLGKQASLY